MAETNALLGKVMQRGRRSLNHFGDAVIDLSDKFLRVYELPRPIPEKFSQSFGRGLGDVGYLLRDAPLLRAWTLTGTEWSVLFIGTRKGLGYAQQLFSAEGVAPQPAGEVPLWKLSSAVRQGLLAEADLVICELSRIHPLRPRAPLAFTVPIWVNQLLAIPDGPETILTGNEGRHLRYRVNRFRKAGYAWRFSRSREDFDLFYHRMYLPFVRSRHGERALVAPYSVQWDFWLASGRGGVVLITRDGQPVAGTICHLTHDICYGVEMGVLDADPVLQQQGINRYVVWCALEWGHAQGAKYCNMGGSHGWRSHGSFQQKAQWGPRVIHSQRPSRHWTLLASDLPGPLRERINQLGFISEQEGAFYGVVVAERDPASTEKDLDRQIAEAKKQGLAGLMEITAGAPPDLYP